MLGTKNHYAGLLDTFKTLPEWKTLTKGQQRFAELFFTGANIALLGSAGTGKSYVIKVLHDFLSRQGKPFAKTATTGIAAFNIGGQTIHSWAGLGLADEDVKFIIEKVKKNSKAQARIRGVKTLLIDEVSMAKGDLLNKIDMVFKYFRHSSLPFGGAQIVMTGDWLQLSPIFKGDDKKEYAFQCRAWKEAKIKAINLTEIMRQSGDSVFADLLNRIRTGNTSDMAALDECIDRRFPADGIEAVRIFCKNVDVDSYNAARIDALTTPPKTFYAKDSGLPHHTEYFNKNCPAPAKLTLKIGAQVMILSNLDVLNGVVNGSVGIVNAFLTTGVEVKLTNGSKVVVENDSWEIKEQEVGVAGTIRYKVVATRTQLPLKVCYSVTCHKVQGMTLDRAIIDMNEAFDSGMVYVALSRVRNLKSLSIVDFPLSKIRVSKECLAFYENLENPVEIEPESI